MLHGHNRSVQCSRQVNGPTLRSDGTSAHAEQFHDQRPYRPLVLDMEMAEDGMLGTVPRVTKFHACWGRV